MRPPFPGMDPWLEHPAIWPDVHNRLIAAIADVLTPRVAPKYFVGLEQRIYDLDAGEAIFVGRPDVLVGGSLRPGAGPRYPGPGEVAGVGVLDVELEMGEVKDWFLEVHEVRTGVLVTAIEILSPVNKANVQGRAAYMQKRQRVLTSRSNLVEIDLLRAGEPMPFRGVDRTDYRILVSRGASRPRAKLYTFNVRQAIPVLPIPLLPEDAEPELDLGAVLHALYDRARFDLRLDYARPPVPPLGPEDAEWARAFVGGAVL